MVITARLTLAAFAGAWAALGAAAAMGTTTTAPQKRLNFIHLLMDDTGFGDISAYGTYGDTKVKTPNIDRIARSGAMLTRGYSASSVCSPSRAAWMTSRFPSELGIYTAGDTDIPKGVPVVTKVLHDAGYGVAHYGKWHIGATNQTGPPSAFGLDDSATFDSPSTFDPRWPPLIQNCSAKTEGSCYWSAKTSAAVVNLSIAFINATVAAGKPFYVNAWFHVSHAVLDPSPDQYERFPLGTTCRLAVDVPGHNQTNCPHRVLWAAQRDTDDHIGRLLDFLGAADLRESTLIAFSTDNGPEEQMVYYNAVGSPGPFRGRKRSLYDGGIRLPFLFSLPGSIPPRVVNGLTGAVDWMPTVLALAGVPPVSSAEGQDLSMLGLMSNATTWARQKPLLWDWRYAVSGPCVNDAPQLAAAGGVADDRLKLLVNTDGSRVELYNREAEPGFEGTNVANVSEHAADVTALKDLALTWWKTKVIKPVSFPHSGCMAIPKSLPSQSNSIEDAEPPNL